MLHTILSRLIWLDVTPLQKTFNCLQIPVKCCQVQWGISQIVWAIHIHTLLSKQPLDDVNAATGCNCNEKGSLPIPVLLVQHCLSFLAHL